MTEHTATYSPEDNKLRLYPAYRLDADEYARVKEAGFKWAPKQDLFFAPMWTPSREDLILEMCDGEIGDEDTSLVERAAERADRFRDYSHNRAKDAQTAKKTVDAIADNIPLGQPILVGHHSEKHARKDAERIENGMRKSIRMWEQSQYWRARAAGALRHAKYKELPAVRARRIKGLEADLRKQMKTKLQAEKFLKAWSSKPNMETALEIANFDHISMCFPLSEYPRNPPACQYEGMTDFWSALTDGVITAEQAAALAILVHERMITDCERWIAHLENRLAYERAMLQESGGTVTNKKGPEKGGAIRCWASPRGGWSYIHKVNKVSVTALDNWGNGDPNFTRTIKLTDIKAVMTAAEVQEKRDTGMLVECEAKDANGLVKGFILRDAPLPIQKTPPQEPKEAEAFDTMRAQLRSGIKAVAVPQLFPTPPELAAKMVELSRPFLSARILEPSAGTGSLLKALPPLYQQPELAEKVHRKTCCDVVAVEIDGDLCALIEKSGFAERVICTDFLQCTVEGEPSSLGRFDIILMNPPFEHGADIKHIQNALKFLKPGGRLVALCANGPRQREAFMDKAEHWEELPEGTFKDAGTMVNAALMVLVAEAEEPKYPEIGSKEGQDSEVAFGPEDFVSQKNDHGFPESSALTRPHEFKLTKAALRASKQPSLF